MIKLRDASKLDSAEIVELKKDLKAKIEEKSELNAYIDVKDAGRGIPILIKDNINVKGWEVTCSSNMLKGYISPYNATVIKKLANSGMTPFGRANMDEFAMGSSTETSCYGKTLNPHDGSKVPGGSSGGSAAAVGGGVALAALGSDTGGSIRQPAAFCGCVGFKPTYGSVSRYGLVAFSSSLDQIGPITQDVKDASFLYDALSGYDSMDSTSAKREYKPTYNNLDSSKKLTVAVLDEFVKDADEDIKKAYEESIKALESRGHKIVRKSMSNVKYHVATYYIVATAEASSNLARFDGIRYGNRVEAKNLNETYIKTRSQGFGDEVKRRILLGTFVLSSGYYDAYYLKAQKVRHLIKDEYEEIFKEADVILSPVTTSAAFGFGSKKSPLEMYLSDVYTISVNLAGLPALALPVGKNDAGLPLSMQLVGRAFDEQTLLDAALSLEEAIQ
ncbi:MAG: Asp-tRNA(Asn)/Glu-tRNA(Gln) amidotransferase subunit GatA [Campylobacterales bacterium]